MFQEHVSVDPVKEHTTADNTALFTVNLVAMPLLTARMIWLQFVARLSITLPAFH